MIIDKEEFKVKLGFQDRKKIDERILYLTTRLSHQPSNTSSHSRFVLNAIWIRSFICGDFDGKPWEDLWKVTSLKYIESQEEVILSFMEPVHFNSLLVTSVARDSDLPDLCKLFGRRVARNEAIHIHPKALARLQTMYEKHRSAPGVWQGMFGELKEVTILNVIEKFVVKKDSKRGIIKRVIEGASFESVRSYDSIKAIFHSLSCQHDIYGMAKKQIEKSVTDSLSYIRRNHPTLKDVSDLIKSSIGWALDNKEGWSALMRFLQRNNVLKRDYVALTELFADIYDVLLRGSRHFNDRKTEYERVIVESVQSAKDKFALAAAFFQIAIERQDIFTGPDESLCPQIAKIIIDQTGLASIVRTSPEKMLEIPSFELNAGSNEIFSQCLAGEFIKTLTMQCSNINLAVEFCTSASFIDSNLVTDIASDILINSFSNWQPSNLQDLLEVEAVTLEQVYKLSIRYSQEGSAPFYAQKLKTIVSRWAMQYARDGQDADQLSTVMSYWTKDKRDALVAIGGESFPTKDELEKKILEIDNVIQTIRSKLVFHAKKNGSVTEVSIRDLAAAYRVDTSSDTALSKLTAFFDVQTPTRPLSYLHSEHDRVDTLVTKHARELHAAAYFLSNKSSLFQSGIGSWAQISFDDFLSATSTCLDKLEMLLSPAALLPQISEAAQVILQAKVNVEQELEVIKSFEHIAIDGSIPSSYLQHSMTIATMAGPIRSFIDCCTAYQFLFTTADALFAELTCISDQLNEDESIEMNVSKCYEVGCRIADILAPDTDSLNLSDRLNGLKFAFNFLDALRFCSGTFQVAKERMWFGEDGLQTFYKEYSNVSNMFTSNQESYESEILDRLEPTIRVVSTIGGALTCTSVAAFLSTLKSHDDIGKVEEMRLVQSNICKIQVRVDTSYHAAKCAQSNLLIPLSGLVYGGDGRYGCGPWKIQNDTEVRKLCSELEVS